LRVLLIMILVSFTYYLFPATIVVIVVVPFVVFLLVYVHALLILFPLLHPVKHLRHSLVSVLLVFLHLAHLRKRVVIGPSKVPSEDSLQLLSVFLFDVFHVFFKCLLLIGLVYVDRIVDQLLQLHVQIVPIVLVLLMLFIDGFHIVIVFLIV